MNKLLGFFVLYPVIAFSSSISPGSSQVRLPNETFQDAYIRAKEALPIDQIHSLIAKDTPAGKKISFNQLDYTAVVEVKTQQELLHLFYVIRDTRFLSNENTPDFQRRISWLYPDDGCFARAAVAGMRLADEDLLRPSKIFAFGNLTVDTPYSPHGSVSWWYHVAPIVKFGGVIYVLDPALDSTAPMTVEHWFNQMGNSTELKGAVCNPYTYDPFDSCNDATYGSDSHAYKDESRFLVKEWNRVSLLGFDPYNILGTSPPWVLDAPQFN